MTADPITDELEKARPALMGLAFRLLGSKEEAEDAVQDTAYRWLNRSGPLPDEPQAWLTRVCTNRCIDILRSARRAKTDYVGPWLPDILPTDEVDSPEHQAEIASSLSVAFLLLLERLTPRERAAYLLHDIFDIRHDVVGEMLGVSAENSRQLSSRARRMIGKENVRYVPPVERQRELLEKFQQTIETGDIELFAAMLSEDVDLRADSGGLVPAASQIIRGRQAVHAFLKKASEEFWRDASYQIRSASGAEALLVMMDEKAHALVSFSYTHDGTVRSLYIQRHPHKLSDFLSGKVLPDKTGALLLH